MDRTILDLSRQKIEYAGLGSILQGDPEALLFVSFTGDDEAELVAPARPLVALWRAARPRLPHAAGGHPAPSRARCSRCASPPRAC